MLKHTSVQGNRSVSIASEKEELLRGMEVMKRTQKWYQDRMEQLSLEEKQMAGSSYTHEVCYTIYGVSRHISYWLVL